MSYYTQHELHWDDDNLSEEEVLKHLAPMLELPADEATDIILHGHTAKWYDSDDHVSSVSTRWPTVLFTMTCHGEDGEHYVTFFRNGRALTKDYVEPVFDENEFNNDAMPQPGPSATA